MDVEGIVRGLLGGGTSGITDIVNIFSNLLTQGMTWMTKNLFNPILYGIIFLIIIAWILVRIAKKYKWRVKNEDRFF